MRTTSLKLGHVVARPLIHSRLSVSYLALLKVNASHDPGALSSSIGFIVVIIKYPLENCFIGRPVSARQEVYNLFASSRTPPLTGLKGLPTPDCARVAGTGLWTAGMLMTESVFCYYHKNHSSRKYISSTLLTLSLVASDKHFVCDSHQRTL